MLKFTSFLEIKKARLPPKLIPLVEKHLRVILAAYQPYNSDDDGFLALITPSDTDQNLGERLGWKWMESCFEGISRDMESQCFVTMILRNNQFAITLLVPDEHWLDPAIRTRLINEIEGGDNDE